MKKIVLTGGGTAGHVTPNIALLPDLHSKGFEVSYIGSYKGIEKQLIEKENIRYYAISSGKLRRYFDFKNFIDPFKVLLGYFQAKKVLKKEKPSVIFSKGGFVAVPAVIAAKHLGIKIIIHESDISPGLANKLCFKSADYICCNFPETLKYLPKDKARLTGSPIRRELLSGNASEAMKRLNFKEDKPVILVIGGSLGSVIINRTIRENLDEILAKFNIIHICGKNNLASDIKKDGYVQFEYVSEELKDYFALSALIISRAGANSICEIAALKKPNILIPLSAKASRGDQILNAVSYKDRGFSEVIFEEDLTKEVLLKTIDKCYANREFYINNMKKANTGTEIEEIMKLICELV